MISAEYFPPQRGGTEGTHHLTIISKGISQQNSLLNWSWIKTDPVRAFLKYLKAAVPFDNVLILQCARSKKHYKQTSQKLFICQSVPTSYIPKNNNFRTIKQNIIEFSNSGQGAWSPVKSSLSIGTYRVEKLSLLRAKNVIFNSG